MLGLHLGTVASTCQQQHHAEAECEMTDGHGIPPFDMLQTVHFAGSVLLLALQTHAHPQGTPPPFLLLREHSCHSRHRETVPRPQREWTKTRLRLCWFDGHCISGEHAVQRGRTCGRSTTIELPEVIPLLVVASLYLGLKAARTRSMHSADSQHHRSPA